MPIQTQQVQINYGFINVGLNGNSISGDPTTVGIISGVTTSATAVFDVTLSDPPVAWDPNTLYSPIVTPIGSSNLTWGVTNLGVNGFTVTFRNAAGTPTSPSAGFTAAVLLVIG
jgi:hypothetical protein